MIMFEMLAINWGVNPEIVAIGPLSLRWYSILFISGFVLGWYIFKWFFKREGITTSLLDPLLYTLLIGTIVGARLGHCLLAAGKGFAKYLCHGKVAWQVTVELLP